MLPKSYPYNVAGVSFGTRQAYLKKLYDGDIDFDVELRPYVFEDEPALGVYFDGVEVGSIRASDVEAVSDILENKDPFVGGEVDVFETDEGDMMYSATVLLVVDETPPELIKRAPEPETKKEPKPVSPRQKKLSLVCGIVAAVLGVGLFGITGDALSWVLVALGALLAFVGMKK